MSAPPSTRILLIEDNRGDYVLTREYLRELEGYRFEIDWQSNYQDALKALSEIDYQICLVDYLIGSNTGIELVTQATQQGVQIPFIMLTGVEDTSVDKAAMAAGAADYLIKNELSAQILERSIRYALEQHRLLSKLTQMAKYDPLTSIANRALFNDFLTGAIGRASRSGNILAIMLLDLDHFKRINDRLGHAAGDRLLQQIADCLQRCIRSGDLVARLGGDEFALILDDVGSIENAARIASKIIHEVGRPIQIDDSNEVDIGISIGITLYSTEFETPDEFLEAADVAMYQAKSAGRATYRFFEPYMQAQALQQATLEKELRHAIDNDLLEVHYQPQVDATQGLITGFEALARWSRNGQYCPPCEFIPIAEQTGLIISLDQWVLRQACLQRQHWHEIGLISERTQVAVNLSGRHFSKNGLDTSISETLAQTRSSGSGLEIELTETTMLEDPETAVAILSKINRLGVRIAIDDFGTGYSSLSYLKHLPFDSIKIDQSFVRDIGVCVDGETIVKATIGLAHQLGLDVIAEGVETRQQAEFLLSNRCTRMQGYYFSKPLAPEQFEALLLRLNSNRHKWLPEQSPLIPGNSIIDTTQMPRLNSNNA